MKTKQYIMFLFLAFSLVFNNKSDARASPLQFLRQPAITAVPHIVKHGLDACRGPNAFKQYAGIGGRYNRYAAPPGYLRRPWSDNPLGNTIVHPEQIEIPLTLLIDLKKLLL